MKEADAEMATVDSQLADDDKELVEDDTNDAIETEEDRRAALNKLSKVKKYKICPIALYNLGVVGREMLGPGLRESRLKEREDQQKFIAQIHEAVAHFKSSAKTRREDSQRRLTEKIYKLCWPTMRRTMVR